MDHLLKDLPERRRLEKSGFFVKNKITRIRVIFSGKRWSYGLIEWYYAEEQASGAGEFE